MRPPLSLPLRRAVPVAVLVATAGCTLLLETERAQCVTDADCAAGGAGLVCREGVCHASEVASPAVDAGEEASLGTGPWACLASPPRRAPEDRSRTLVIRRRYVAYSLNDCEHNRPIVGAGAKLCAQEDVSCGSPIETTTTDCDGYATFHAAYRGFKGFVLLDPPRRPAVDGGQADWPAATRACFEQLRAKEAAEGRSGDRCAIRTDASGNAVVPLPDDLNPGLEEIVPPPTDGDSPTREIPVDRAPTVLSTNTLRQMLAVIGKSFDTQGAHVVTQSLDCGRDLAAGVTLTMSSGIGANSQVYYTDAQGLPNVNQGETAANGVSGYMNLDPGPTGLAAVTATATRRATGERIGAYPLLLRSGYVTFLEVSPLAN